ncbi:dihydrolipoamide acetyltransferase family protein [Halobacillus sp. B23F22_1]|uniref:dihydrolipoamide acetyltransferase family protein n=1 Tax=Halobacillus sp. B23F22_1 TaxID=3459514 RepID=UPI00373EBC30
MYEVKMPRLGVTMQNGTINQWLVDEGEEVNKGDFIFEIETEKSTLEIEAQESGVLKKVIVSGGEEVPVNTIVGIIADADEDVDVSAYLNPSSNEQKQESLSSAETTNVATAVKSKRKKAVPRARKLAKEMGISLDEIEGTGKYGLITVEDVKGFVSADTDSQLTVKETISLNHVKKAMGDNMLKSWQTIPQFTQMVTVRMENVLAVKKELEVSLNDLLVKAVGQAAADYPIVNSQLSKDKKVNIFEQVNVSVAVNSSHGLVVPVLKNVPEKRVDEISKEVKELAKKAEANELRPEDYVDGTITVSNLGSVGIESGTPIINSPQSTIVFAGAIKNTPIVNEEGEVVVAPVMSLSICYDHRFIDGITGAEFTNQLRDRLERLSVEDVIS